MIRRTLCPIVLALALIAAPQLSRAQFVVFDPANLTQMIVDWLQDLQEYRDYVEEMQKFDEQLEFDESTLNAMLGSRGLGNLLMQDWDRKLRRYVPSPESLDTYRLTCLGGYVPDQFDAYCDNLTDIILGAMVPEPEQVFEPSMEIPDDSQWAYEKRLEHSEHSMAAALEAQRQAGDRINAVESLVESLNADNSEHVQTVDLKRSVDLTGRITAENALLQAETNRLLSQLLELQAHELHSTLGPEARERQMFHFADQAFLDQWLD